MHAQLLALFSQTEAFGEVTRKETISPASLFELSCQTGAHAGPAAAFLSLNLLIKLFNFTFSGTDFFKKGKKENFWFLITLRPFSLVLILGVLFNFILFIFTKSNNNVKHYKH